MHLRASLCLDGFERPLSPDAVLSQRLQMVLGTRPGQIPWRPGFGCDLWSLVGEPATSSNLTQARRLVLRALSQWMADVEVVDVSVRFSPHADPGSASRHPTVPLAEAALLSLGVQVGLEVQVEVKVPRGSTTILSAQLEPSNP